VEEFNNLVISVDMQEHSTIFINNPSNQPVEMEPMIPIGTDVEGSCASSDIWTHESKELTVQIPDIRPNCKNAQTGGQSLLLLKYPNMKDGSLNVPMLSFVPIGKIMTINRISKQFT
jgi:hypothetical protein